MPLKRSAEYAGIRRRVAHPRAIDSWQEEGLHYFVFQLKAAEGAEATPETTPVAVSAMHPTMTEPVSAVVITPTGSGDQAEVVNLRDPDQPYTLPIMGG